jgi:hypothetical protein
VGLEATSALITAIGTAVIAGFTGVIFSVHRAQLRHQRRIERPYISGGGAPARSDPTQFVLTVQNYGKTPGVIAQYALRLCPRGNLPPAPEYLNANFPWVPWVAHISPGGQTIPVTTETIPTGPNPVAYGRFRYGTVGGTEQFIFSFILPVGVGDNHSIVANVDPEYTCST